MKLEYFFIIFVFLYALSCGGGQDEELSSTISGTIDASYFEDTTRLEVWAIRNGIREKRGLIEQGQNGEDHTYVIQGLAKGEVYVVSVYRVLTEKLSVEVLSTVLTADGNSSTLELIGRTKSSYRRQINIATTYVAKRYSSLPSSSIATISSEVFGTNTTDVSEIVADRGLLYKGQVAILVENPMSAMAITQMTFASAAVLSMDSKVLVDQMTTFETLQKSFASANEINDITNTLDAYNTIIQNAGSSFQDLAKEVDQVAVATYLNGQSVLTEVLNGLNATTMANNGFSISTMKSAVNGALLSTSYLSAMASLSGISSSQIQTSAQSIISNVYVQAGLSASQLTVAQEAVDNGGPSRIATTTIVINDFSLADTTYGSKSGDNFTLTSLAPVFKISFKDPFTSPFSDVLNVSVTNSVTGAVANLTQLNDFISSHQTDSKTVYLLVHHSSSSKIQAGKELRPGQSYSYSITALKNFALQYEGKTQLSGTMTTTDFTFTLPFDAVTTTQSMVALVGSNLFTGIATSASPLFNVHSKYGILFTTNGGSDLSFTTDYGLFGSHQKLDIRVNGASAVNSGRHFRLSDLNYTAQVNSTSAYADGFAVTLDASLLSTGRHTISISTTSQSILFDSNNDGVSDGVVDSTWQLPSSYVIEVP